MSHMVYILCSAVVVLVLIVNSLQKRITRLEQEKYNRQRKF